MISTGQHSRAVFPQAGVHPKAGAHQNKIAVALRARSLFKTFEAGLDGCSVSVRALDNVNFNLRPGETVGICGEPGAGKSTFLLSLAGVIKPDAGSIEWFAAGGRSLGEPQGVEYVPPWRSTHTMQSVERALAAQPGLLLVDVAIGALQSTTRRLLWQLLAEWRARGVTMVIAARGACELLPFCSRVVVMKSGTMKRSVP